MKFRWPWSRYPDPPKPDNTPKNLPARRALADGMYPKSAPTPRSNPFAISLSMHPPSILQGARARGIAMDSNPNFSEVNSWASGAILNGFWTEGIAFLGYPYLSELAQRPEYRVISETIATEMTRKWIRFTVKDEPAEDDDASLFGEDPKQEESPDDYQLGTDRAPDYDLTGGKGTEDPPDYDLSGGGEGDDYALGGENPEFREQVKADLRKAKADEKAQRVSELEAEFKRLNVRNLFARAAEQDGFFGRGHIFIDTGDTDNPTEMDKSIGDGWDAVSVAKVGKGSIKSLRTVEAVWCYPTSYNSNNPLKDDWYRPNSWYVQATIVHSSRLLTFIGREVPDMLKPSYSFGGLSLSQMAQPYVTNWLETRQSVNDIISAFSTFVLATDLQASVQADGQQMFKRAEFFNMVRDNRGLMMIDKESETFQNVAAPLGGLHELQAQAQEHMASVSHIPTVKLLGIQPSGLNADSEGVMRSFYDYINSYQEHLFRDKLHRLLGLVQLNLWGETDDSIDFEFEPLWSLDEKGEADVNKTKADTDVALINAGVIGPEESRKRVAADSGSDYKDIDVNNPPDLKQEEEQGLEPPGGRPNPLAEGQEDGAPGGGKLPFGAQDATPRQMRRYRNLLAQDEAGFEESKHKRDNDGKFSSTGGGGTKAPPKPGSFNAAMQKIAGLKKSNKKDVHVLMHALLGNQDEVSGPDTFHKAMKLLASKPAAQKQAFATALNDLLDKGIHTKEKWANAEDVPEFEEDMSPEDVAGGAGFEKVGEGINSTPFSDGKGAYLNINKKTGVWVLSKGGKNYQGTSGEELGAAIGDLQGEGADPVAPPKPSVSSAQVTQTAEGAGYVWEPQDGDEPQTFLFNKGESKLEVNIGTGGWMLQSPGHATKVGTTAEGLDALLNGGDWAAHGVKNAASATGAAPVKKSAPTGQEPHAVLLSKIAAVRPKPTAAQKSAIGIYKGSGYGSMNDKLRNSGVHTESTQQMYDWLEGASLPEDATLWRGIKGDYSKVLKSVIDEGTIFRDRGFISTSTHRKFSENWSGTNGNKTSTGNMLMRIDVKKGQKGAAIRPPTEGDGEYEVVLQSDSRLKVVSFDWEKGFVHCELIQH